MDNNNNYVNILVDSLQKKMEILSEIIELNEQQKEIITKEKLDMDKLDENMRDKSELISRLNMLDDGFQSVFDGVKDELTTHKDKYQEEIIRMQNCIKKITEQSMNIQVEEQRNKVALEKQFKNTRDGIKKARMSSRMASDYYKGMTGMKAPVEPQFLDSKK